MVKLLKNKIITHNAKQLFLYIVLAIGIIFAIFPVIWVILTAFKPLVQTYAIPPVYLFSPTLDGFRMLFFESSYAFGVRIFHNLYNSIIVATSTTVITLILATLAAYSLSRFDFKGKQITAFGILTTKMLPPIATIIPMFLLINTWGLMDTKIGLIIAYMTIKVPLATWMLKGFLDEIPPEVEDQALIDGCSRMGVLLRITLPLIAPGLGATAIFAFLMGWNEYPLAMILSYKDAQTLPLVATAFKAEEGIYWGPMCAAASIALIPPILFAVIAIKAIIKGLAFGAVKG